MQKVFKQDQQCPFGQSCMVDSPTCRQCDKYYGAAGYLYIRCGVQGEPVPEQRAKERAIKKIVTTQKRKRGRPKGTLKGPKKK